MDPSESRRDQGFRTSVQSPPPTVSLAAPRIGLIEVGGVLASLKTPGARRYAASALADISSLQRSRHPCGWIVDLRANGGGSMYPMLLSVGPILGSGRLIGFTDKKRARDWVSYRSNTLFYGSGDTDPAPARIPDFSPAPAVAVLTGPHTASSEEAVAIAFRDRLQTRSLGPPPPERRPAPTATGSPTAQPSSSRSVGHRPPRPHLPARGQTGRLRVHPRRR